MQVSLSTVAGLERRMEVAVPAERVSAEIETRLKSVARTARLKGFRPGKAPLPVVRQQFGAQVQSEVVGDLLRESWSDAVTQQSLRPATDPRIELVSAEPGAELRYVASFEVLRHNSTCFALPEGGETAHDADAAPSPASISFSGDRLLGIGPPLLSGVSST